MLLRVLFRSVILIVIFTYTLSGQSLPNYVPSNGLVGWWPFNGNANDESGNGNNGVVTGATLTQDRDGVLNSAYEFDYTNWNWGSGGDRIFIPHDVSFSSPNITVSIWAKRYSNGYGGNELLRMIGRTQNGYSNPFGEYWALGHRNQAGNYDAYAWITDASQNSSTSIASTPSLNDWHHYVLTYDGSYLKFYIDGSVQDSSNASNAINTGGTSGISIGLSIQANGEWFPYDGVLDDAGYWDRALTSTEVTALYTGTPVSTNTCDLLPSDNETICTGDSITLSVNSLTNVSWSTGDTTTSIRVAPIQETAYWVTDGMGCYDTTYVQTLDARIISSRTNVCAPGDTVLLHSSKNTGHNNVTTSIPYGLSGGNALYVSVNGNDLTGNGSLNSPFRTIQKGIDAASSGQSVNVLPGTYRGSGNVAISLQGKNIVLQSTNGPNRTIIDGEDINMGFYLSSGESASSVIRGFTIKNCLSSSKLGSAIFVEDNSGISIRSCIFKENKQNTTDNSWVILFGDNEVSGPESFVDSCLFIDNFSGLLKSSKKRWHMRYCLVQGNKTKQSLVGNGHDAGNDYDISFCVFRNNESTANSLIGLGHAKTLRQSFFIENTSSRGVVYMGTVWSGTNIVDHCTFFNNTCVSFNNNVYDHVGAVKSSVFYGSTGLETVSGKQSSITFAYSLGSLPAGTGNVSGNPLFVNPTINNFSYNPGSPCIGNGESGTDIGASSTSIPSWLWSYQNVERSTALWSTGVNNDSILVLPTTTTEYWLEQSLNGKVCSDTVKIKVGPVSINSLGSKVCVGDSASLTVEGSSKSATLYKEDFESLVGSEWSSSAVMSFNSSKVLGNFDNTSVTLSLSGLPTDSLTISFDLWLHDTWDGNSTNSVNGPDFWKFRFNQSVLLNTTFNNHAGGTQSYPNQHPSSTPSFTDNAERVTNDLCSGGQGNTKYRLEFKVYNANPTGVFTFVGEQNQSLCDESWSIDNVTITGRESAFSNELLWSTGDTASSIKVSPSQTTTYWVTNGAGCSDTAQINVNTTNFNVLPDSIVSCSTDSVLFQLSGYDSYLWSDGSVDSTNYLKNNALGSHWVQLSNGQCLGSDTSIISLGNMKVEIGNVSEITCKGYHNGSLHASVVGAQGAYQYLWSNGSTSDTIETLSAGQYWVEVTDSLGCVATDTLVLTEPAALSVAVVLDSINGYNVSCFNDRNGNGYMVPSGGEAPYTYNWNVIPTVFDSTISQLAAGNNQWAMVIDKNGCFATDTFDVLQPSPLTVSTFLIDSVSCFGGSNGAAFAQTLGGTGVSTYSWSNGFVTDTAAGLNNGAYQVVATDLNGCKAADSIKIYQPSPLTVSAVINTNFNGYGVPCAGDTIGSASVVASGSNGGFSYLWNTNTNNDTITNLAVGQYFVTVTDRKNCSMNDTVLVLEPDTLRMSIVSDTNLFGNHLDCYLDQTALVYAKSSGGAGSLAYQWSTSATNDSVFGLGAGSYWLSVSDANACSTSDTVNLFEPTALTVTAAVSSNYNGYDISCAGLSDAEVSALASGSNGGYLYVWSSGDTSSVVDSLSANNYFVTVTDSLGCQSQEVVSVSNPPALSASLNSSFYNSFGVSCYGSSDGFAYVNATGGATGYTYSWNTMSSNDSITGISAGEYLVEITDLNGCVVKDSIVLSQPDSLNLILDVLTNYNGYNVSCFGASDASLNSTVSGGVPQYNYSWLFGGQVSSTSAGALGQSFGWHLLEIEDQNGCQKMDSVFVTQPDSMYSISNVISNYNGYGVRCFDSEDGIASVQTFGGAQPYLHTWNSGLPSNDTVIKNLGGGTSVLMITDANGCNSFDSVVVSVPDSIWYSSSVSNVKCFGENTGALRLVPAGGVPSYSVDWLTLATASDTIYGIGADTYSFVITDTNGCKMTDSIEVFESLQILSVLDTTMPTCAQINDGELNVSSSGGAAPYVYYVNDSLVQTPVLNLGAGQYWVKTVDSLGCSISSELFLSPQNEECFGIPNLFSPNGDSYNDSWRIRMPKDYTYEVFVYSPLGQLVFQGDEQIEWEGTYKGEGVANGDYYYVMIINNNNKINGYVTIIR